MAKTKNYYQVLGFRRPCNLLKTNTINPTGIHVEILSKILSRVDCCILHNNKVFYFNQCTKTCTLVESNNDFYNLLYTKMEQLEYDSLTQANAEHLTYITELTQHNNLPIDASTQDIKNTYRRLARENHPDKNLSNQEAATKLFQEISAAHETLSNEEERAKYDKTLLEIAYSPSTSPETSSDFLTNMFMAYDIKCQKQFPAQYKDYTNPERDFTTENRSHVAYRLRERLYAPDGESMRYFNYLPHNQPIPGRICSQRTVKSYNKHFSQRFFAVDYGHKQNILKLPSKKSLYFKVMDREYYFQENIKKNFASTFLPFQEIATIYNIFLQPFNGAKYLFIGIVFIILSIIILPLKLYCAVIAKNRRDLLAPLFIPGITFIAIGLGLLLTSPLTWFVQMPIRTTLNLLLQGWGLIEDGYHIQRLIAEAEKAIELENKLDCITSIALLHKKFQLNVDLKMRLTDINPQDEKARYEVLDKDFVLGTLNVCSDDPITQTQKSHLESYLSLFKTAKNHKKCGHITDDRSANFSA